MTDATTTAPTAVRRQGRGEDAHGRRLPGPVRAEQTVALTLVFAAIAIHRYRRAVLR